MNFLSNGKINISDIRLIVKDNLIGFEGIGIHNYYDNFNIRTSQLKDAYEYILSKYSDIEDVFLTIINTIINNNYDPCATILMSCYYLKYIEDKGVNTLNLISEFRKHKRDSDYLLSSLSVLKMGYYFTVRNLQIAFPKKLKGQPNPDIMVKKNGEKFNVEIKGRGASQLKKIAFEFISMIENPNRPCEWHSFDDGIKNEIEQSELRRIVKDAFSKQKANIVIIDETNNFFQIGGFFMLREMHGNIEEGDPFNLVRNNLVFCSFFGGKFKCFEIDKDAYLRETLPKD